MASALSADVAIQPVKVTGCSPSDHIQIYGGLAHRQTVTGKERMPIWQTTQPDNTPHAGCQRAIAVETHSTVLNLPLYKVDEGGEGSAADVQRLPQHRWLASCVVDPWTELFNDMGMPMQRDENSWAFTVLLRVIRIPGTTAVMLEAPAKLH